ncbi:unnamed protein product [Gordionus sp. m RMFG-2023]
MNESNIQVLRVNTTIKSIETIYATVPVNKLKDYIKNCEVCSLKTTLPKAPTGKAIKSTAVWGRVVMDLIDFSSTPDGEFKYIIHFKDHFSKFTYAKPLISKQGEQTVRVIRNLFFTFGPPKILQSDNGREFKNKMVESMLKDDFPGVIFAHSRPRHPETNGLIERANGTLESRISGYMLETKKYDWATALPKIVFNINLGFSRTIKNTPFNVFFARTPYSVDSEQEVIPEIVNVDSDHEEMSKNL